MKSLFLILPIFLVINFLALSMEKAQDETRIKIRQENIAKLRAIAGSGESYHSTLAKLAEFFLTGAILNDDEIIDYVLVTLMEIDQNETAKESGALISERSNIQLKTEIQISEENGKRERKNIARFRFLDLMFDITKRKSEKVDFHSKYYSKALDLQKIWILNAAQTIQYCKKNSSCRHLLEELESNQAQTIIGKGQ